MDSNKIHYEGYWSQYPENNLPEIHKRLPLPRPNHFSQFWKTNRTFIAELTNVLLRAEKHYKPTTSKCHLCKAEFYNMFEYKYTTQTHTFFIASTIFHYYKAHKIVPSKELQELVKQINKPTELTKDILSATKEDKELDIEDDWIDIESPTPLPMSV